MFSCSMKRHILVAAAAVPALAALTSAASAHTGLHVAGLGDGLAHPFSGLDHILAMAAVGLWASQLGRPAYWLLPVTFPLVMALGAVMAATGLALPWTEIGIAASVLVLGAAVALSLRPAILLSIALIALFALFHGYSHGTELAQSASALAYAAGFVAATLALHGIGLALGTLSASPAGRIATRGAGVAIACAGAVLLVLA
jgi:urease accessory protein